jgi:hypothetical protein
VLLISANVIPLKTDINERVKIEMREQKARKARDGNRLCLSVCYSIAKRHNDRIDIDNYP